MKEEQYKDYNKKNYKKTIIVLFVVIFILLLCQFLLSTLSKEQKNNELSYSSLRSVKDVIEYYESTYISESESEETEYYLDIFLKFKVLPYDENDNSNETYYNTLIEEVAKVIRYKSFKMIDLENEITIKVVCENNKIESIIINDIEDYFIYMDSQISMKKYVEIKSTEFVINSPILQSCINNNWDNNINFGTRESIFDEYYIYFDEGIKVKTIQNKIYNIIFNKKYSENVINDLFPGIDLANVEVTLGKPSFEDEKLGIIGYKGNEMYVFFTNEEISIYRTPDVDIEDFFGLSDRFIAEKIDFLDFMNELTYIWPDYSEYEYTENTMFIAYPLKGIEIKLNYDDISGILVYNNIKSTLPRIQEYLENTNFVSRLQIDAVFEAEKRRVNKIIEQTEKCNDFKESLEDDQKALIGESFRYEIYPMTDINENIYGMKFISLSEDNPNRELNDSMDYYMWINNDNFIYSKEGKGIYIYSLIDGSVRRLLEGNDTYELKEYDNGILKYDDKQINV